MTDDLFETIKSDFGLRHMLGDLGKDDSTILLLNIIKAIDDQESNPIFLRSIKETEKKG